MLKLGLSLVLVSSLAMAAGFEKTTLLSGKYQGIAGAATSSVVGPESLYFNPAGLVGSKKTNEITLSLSPTQMVWSGPTSANNSSETSTRQALVPGLFYGRQINDKVGVGIGYFATGGNIAEYSQVQFTPTAGAYTYRPDIYTKLGITELSVGGAYKVTENLKVGAAWRMGTVHLDQAGAGNTGTALIGNEFRGLKGTNTLGFKIGAQYDGGDWGAGINYRNAMHVAANGKLYAKMNTAAGATFDSTETDMSLKTQFPQQLAIGGHKKFSDTFTGFADYSWTNYGAIDQLLYEGSYTLPVVGTRSLGNVFTGMSDQHVVRLAGECTSWGMPVRVGYAYTTRVGSNNFANATFGPPAPSHTVSTGTSYDSGDWRFDGAMDYTMFRGSVGANESLSTATFAGDYKADVYALHLGATYGF